MATPQCAMAQPGSLWATAANAAVEAENQKEWSMATARSNSPWTGALHDVGKWTVPTLSWAAAAPPPSASSTARVRGKLRTVMVRPPGEG